LKRPRQSQRTRSISNENAANQQNRPLYPPAHSGLVAGSSPAGPTSLRVSRVKAAAPEPSWRRRAVSASYGSASQGNQMLTESIFGSPLQKRHPSSLIAIPQRLANQRSTFGLTTASLSQWCIRRSYRLKRTDCTACLFHRTAHQRSSMLQRPLPQCSQRLSARNELDGTRSSSLPI
jgi:ribosomal protein L37E